MGYHRAIWLIFVLGSCSTENKGGAIGRAEMPVEHVEIQPGAEGGEGGRAPFNLPPGAVIVDPPAGLEWAVRIPVDPPILSEDRAADSDGDGILAEDDPDDNDSDVLPPTREMLCNGRDEDGDGLDSCPADVDGDGAHGGIDCDDLDAAIGPLARELRCDGVDQNCDGHDLCDTDGDGVVDWNDSAPEDPLVGIHPSPSREESD